MQKASLASIDMSALTAAIAQAVTSVLLGQMPAAPAPAPIAPTPPAPRVKMTWAQRAEDKVVAWLDTNGMPRNQYGMTLKRAEAMDLSGLLFRYEQGDRSMLRDAPGKQPAAEPSPAYVAAAAIAARELLALDGQRQKKKAVATVRQVLLADGEGWLHCPECSAYWSAAREDAFLQRKYTAHLKGARHLGK